MRTQSILSIYKNIPNNSVKMVKTGIVLKSDNSSIIHVVPNLKREFMMQIGDTFQTGITFYEGSSLAELHYNNRILPFNTNKYAFLKQDIFLKENSKSIKNNIKISQNDKFKHVLEKVSSHDITQVLANIYTKASLQYRQLFEVYKRCFKKDFFTNKSCHELYKKIQKS